MSSLHLRIIFSAFLFCFLVQSISAVDNIRNYPKREHDNAPIWKSTLNKEISNYVDEMLISMRAKIDSYIQQKISKISDQLRKQPSTENLSDILNNIDWDSEGIINVEIEKSQILSNLTQKVNKLEMEIRRVDEKVDETNDDLRRNIVREVMTLENATQIATFAGVEVSQCGGLLVASDKESTLVYVADDMFSQHKKCMWSILYKDFQYLNIEVTRVFTDNDFITILDESTATDADANLNKSIIRFPKKRLTYSDEYSRVIYVLFKSDNPNSNDIKGRSGFTLKFEAEVPFAPYYPSALSIQHFMDITGSLNLNWNKQQSWNYLSAVINPPAVSKRYSIEINTVDTEANCDVFWMFVVAYASNGEAILFKQVKNGCSIGSPLTTSLNTNYAAIIHMIAYTTASDRTMEYPLALNVTWNVVQ